MDKVNILAERLIKILRERKLTVAFAESCTGGLLAKSLTDMSGASDVFECGVVSYSGKIKHKLLSVQEKTLAAFGEVSEQAAKEMVSGICSLSGAPVGAAVTGIAGPGGGTPEKPVGLIYVALSVKDEIYPYKLLLEDEALTRDDRRKMTAAFVFETLIDLILK